MELGIHRLWNYVELFWNSFDNALSSIVFYLEMKVEVEVGLDDIRSLITPLVFLNFPPFYYKDSNENGSMKIIKTTIDDGTFGSKNLKFNYCSIKFFIC